jgi:hypothetical protein
VTGYEEPTEVIMEDGDWNPPRMTIWVTPKMRQSTRGPRPESYRYLVRGDAYLVDSLAQWFDENLREPVEVVRCVWKNHKFQPHRRHYNQHRYGLRFRSSWKTDDERTNPMVRNEEAASVL